MKRVFEAVKETREECCSVFHPRPWALRGRDEYMAAEIGEAEWSACEVRKGGLRSEGGNLNVVYM